MATIDFLRLFRGFGLAGAFELDACFIFSAAIANAIGLPPDESFFFLIFNDDDDDGDEEDEGSAIRVQTFFFFFVKKINK